MPIAAKNRNPAMRKTMRLEACVATAERGAVLMDAPFCYCRCCDKG
jgi:hypothetical protein